MTKALPKQKLSADAIVYLLKGKSEFISVMLDDGYYANQDAGATTHKGTEEGVNANILKTLSLSCWHVKANITHEVFI